MWNQNEIQQRQHFENISHSFRITNKFHLNLKFFLFIKTLTSLTMSNHIALEFQVYSNPQQRNDQIYTILFERRLNNFSFIRYFKIQLMDAFPYPWSFLNIIKSTAIHIVKSFYISVDLVLKYLNFSRDLVSNHAIFFQALFRFNLLYQGWHCLVLLKNFLKFKQKNSLDKKKSFLIFS